MPIGDVGMPGLSAFWFTFQGLSRFSIPPEWRHLIENFFAKLKVFKRIAMRDDKTDQSFAAFINLAAAIINSR